MSAKEPFQFWVNKNGTVTLIDHVIGNNATPITVSEIAEISYTISLIDENDDNLDTPVPGHEDFLIDETQQVLDTPIVNDPERWNPADHDNKGYNFIYTINVFFNQAFTLRGRRYRIRVKYTPSSGQIFFSEYIAAVR